MVNRLLSLNRRRARVRSKISGTAERPRLSVRITDRHITAQLIDDSRGATLAYVTTIGQSAEGTMTERAVTVGQAIASQAKSKQISRVVFDRGGRIYHGRLDALATAARQAGLEF